MRKTNRWLMCVFALSITIVMQAGYPSGTRFSLLYAKTVVDRAGNRVKLPSEINRILVTCYGGATHEIALLGSAGKIVAHPSVKGFPQFNRIYKNLENLPDAGSFNNINLEYIMALKPDVVIASVTAVQGNERIKQLGIPVVTIGTGHTDVELLLKEFKMMGEILDSEEMASGLVKYWESRLDLIKKRTMSIPRDKKRKVFYTSSGSLSTEGNPGWGQHYITASGGVNVASGIKISGEITPEQLLVWNPDVIITRLDQVSKGKFRTMPILKSLKAAKNNEIYSCPVGTFWWDRPSPEAILGILWLAKNLYSGEMKVVDIKAETFKFYSKFYHYKLTDSEYELFFKVPGVIPSTVKRN